MSTTDNEKEAQRLAREFVDEKIDLSIGPLFGAKLLRLSNREHVLISAVDHLITDTRSHEILCKEIWTLYDQAAQGLPFSLPQPALQFADYAVWQGRTYEAWRENHEAYWRRRLTGAPHIELWFEDAFAETRLTSSEMLHFPFGRTLTAGLHNIARQERTLLPLAVLTIYVAAMSHWCNQRDLVLKFVSHGRQRRPVLQTMIGPLVTALHLRIELAKKDSFADLLKRVTLELDSAYQHHDLDRVPALIPDCKTHLQFNWLPSNQTSGWAPANGTLDWVPFRPISKRIHTTRTQESLDDDGDAPGALKLQPFPLAVRFAHTFTPIFFDTGDDIIVTVVYRPDLLDTRTIEMFGRNLRLFAARLAQHPLARVASMSME